MDCHLFKICSRFCSLKIHTSPDLPTVNLPDIPEEITLPESPDILYKEYQLWGKSRISL